ncbi:TIGR02444 family protein [Geminicoccus flavidas]|uniref:TIGR02444 family protein n=1 Tax=Geminicoccus flavidas TaxID=2506407 RepID=UPI001357B37D|nr:TIGR02444 family protein [Geminicoccus flavidas]
MTPDLFARISALYARPGVAERCLLLQDEFGLDVSLALSAALDGWAGRPWTASDLARLRAEGWDERARIFRALRRARELAKPLAATDTGMARLRRKILQDELQAEQLAVDWLAARLGPPADPDTGSAATAAANLRLVAGEALPQTLLEPILAALRG